MHLLFENVNKRQSNFFSWNFQLHSKFSKHFMAITTFKGQDACAGDSGGPFVLIKGQNISKGIF